MRFWLFLLAAVSALAGQSTSSKPRPPPADPSSWRGFNLLEKFTLRGNAPYREEDFRWIAAWGFNYVRLPLDYRCYTEPGDLLAFRPAVLAEIDQAVAWGEKYGIHVCLNLHRAPGFCINPPAEPLDLWTDPAAERAFVAHWEMFARRYRDVSAARLSFNLLNEPTRNTRESYVRVHAAALAAIHRISPDRPVMIDGNDAGRHTAPEFRDRPHVIQATRGYHPASISHYRASWVKGSDTWPTPSWPPSHLVGRLYGPAKPDLSSPLVLRGHFPRGTTLSLPLRLLSGSARLQVRADGAIVAERTFDPRANPAQWIAVPTDSPWTYHRPDPAQAFEVVLPQPARQLVLANIAGDWLQFDALSIQFPDAPRRTWTADTSWGLRQRAHELTPQGDLRPPAGIAPDQPLADYLRPWREFTAAGGVAFVGEWGAYQRTPHAVTLAWMHNWLERWREANLGWALWYFRGSFGVLDSGRPDVVYENWHGQQLDRAMLTLLQRYRAPGSPPP